MLLESNNSETGDTSISDRVDTNEQSINVAGEVDVYMEVLALAKVLLKEQVEKLSPEEVDFSVDWKEHSDIFHHAVAGTLEEVLDEINDEFNDHTQDYHSRAWLEYPMANAIRLALQQYSEAHDDFDKDDIDIDDMESDLITAFDEYECGDEPGYSINIMDEDINIVLRLNHYEYFQHTKDVADICSLLGLNLREFVETQISFDVPNYKDDRSRCMVEQAADIYHDITSNNSLGMIDLEQNKYPVLDGLSQQEIDVILKQREFEKEYRARLVKAIRYNHENNQDQISIAIKLDLEDLKKINEMVKNNVAYSLTIKGAAVLFLDTMNGSAQDDIKIPWNLEIPSCFFERFEKDSGCIAYVDGSRGYGVEAIFDTFMGGTLIDVKDAKQLAEEVYIDQTEYKEMKRQHMLIGALVDHDSDNAKVALDAADDMFVIGKPIMNWNPIHYSALGFLLNSKNDSFYDDFKKHEKTMFEFNQFLIEEGAHPDHHLKLSEISPATMLPRYTAGAIAAYIKQGATKANAEEDILTLLDSDEARQEVAAIAIIDEFEEGLDVTMESNQRRVKMI